MADSQRLPTPRATFVPDPGEPAHRQTLIPLLSLYWKPVYFYLRRKGLGPARAEDAVRDLFAGLVQSELPQPVDPARDRLRLYLREAANRYVIDRHFRDSRAPRAGGALAVPIDVARAERDLHAVAADPDDAYEREWAVVTLARALDRLGQEGVSGRSRGRPEAILRSSRFDHPRTVAEAAAECGMSVDRFKACLHRTRERFHELLREEVARTASEGGVEDEIRELLIKLRR